MFSSIIYSQSRECLQPTSIEDSSQENRKNCLSSWKGFLVCLCRRPLRTLQMTASGLCCCQTAAFRAQFWLRLLSTIVLWLQAAIWRLLGLVSTKSIIKYSISDSILLSLLMGKKAKNNSKRLKTSHKKGIIKRKTAYTHVDKNLLNVNAFIDQQMHSDPQSVLAPKIEAESMTFDELRRLIDGPAQKKRVGRLRVEDAAYLQPLIKKWGDNYERAAKDIKLNRMQWTANQISKKVEAYNQLLKEDQ